MSQVVFMTVPESIRQNAQMMPIARQWAAKQGYPVEDGSEEEIRACMAMVNATGHGRANGWDAVAYLSAATEYKLSEEWVRAGCQRYKLTDSTAALLRLTSCPPFESDRMPHGAFLIELSSKYLPLPKPDGSFSEASFVLVGRTAGVVQAVAIPGWDTTGMIVTIPDGTADTAAIPSRDLPGAIRTREAEATAQAVIRIISNVCNYLSEFPPAASSQSHGSSRDGQVVTLHPPAGVVVSRELRESAAAVARSHSLAGVRRSMAHFVRGHWRNQACGAGRQDRRRTWVMPHKRGDDSLGRVIERITAVGK